MKCNFYHPDHLGSSSWITDQTGETIQHLQYLPFGDRYVDQRRTGWEAPYTFSGKERDEETEYGYFGARYYSSDLSIWLSVDPRASSYPGLTPYNYCMNSPVMYKDPNGEMPWFIPVIIGAAIQAGTYAVQVAVGNTTWNTGQFFLNMGMGAASGAISAGIGVAFGSVGSTLLGSAALNEVARAASHGVAGIITSGVMGNQPTVSGFVSSCFSSLVGSATAGLHPAAQIGASALTGGIASEMTGGDFMQGFASGLIVSGLNHAMHAAGNTIKANKYVKSARAFLEDLGFPADQVAKDVVTHPSGNWTGKYAQLMNFDKYESVFTGGHYDSYSNTTDAWVSKSRGIRINVPGVYNRMESYALKYYPSRDHSIGIVRVGWGHYYEAGLEKIDGWIKSASGRDDFLYDMHGRNAILYLNFRR